MMAGIYVDTNISGTVALEYIKVTGKDGSITTLESYTSVNEYNPLKTSFRDVHIFEPETGAIDEDDARILDVIKNAVSFDFGFSNLEEEVLPFPENVKIKGIAHVGNAYSELHLIGPMTASPAEGWEPVLGEYYVKVDGKLLYIQEGSGDNLFYSDREEGYVDYIDFTLYKSREVMYEFDGEIEGGMVLLEEPYGEGKSNTADKIVKLCLEELDMVGKPFFITKEVA